MAVGQLLQELSSERDEQGLMPAKSDSGRDWEEIGDMSCLSWNAIEEVGRDRKKAGKV